MYIIPSQITYRLNEIYYDPQYVEVVALIAGTNEHIRIEALFNPHNKQYSTRAFVQKHVTITPTYTSTENPDQKPEELSMWVDYELPWVLRDSAEGALTQALGFLSDRCD